MTRVKLDFGFEPNKRPGLPLLPNRLLLFELKRLEPISGVALGIFLECFCVKVLTMVGLSIMGLPKMLVDLEVFSFRTPSLLKTLHSESLNFDMITSVISRAEFHNFIKKTVIQIL